VTTTRATFAVRLGLLLVVGGALAACSTPKRYESAVQIVRKEWDACPGDQFQVIRGGKAFAECTAKYDVGDEVPVYVRHWWDDRGYYRWDIERMGDCWRTIETESVGSYEKGQECKDVENFGYKAGFQCSRKPFQSLVKRCPWMARE